MKIAVVSYYDDGYADAGIISERNKRNYCAIHGYEFLLSRAPWRAEWVPPFAQWNKIPAVLAAFDLGFDWVLWSDADALIMRPEIDIEQIIDPDVDFLFGCDVMGLNTGNFLAQNTWRARGFLRRLMQVDYTVERNPESPQAEQWHFRNAIHNDWHVFRYRLLGDFLNSHPSMCRGAFIVHMQSMDHRQRVLMMEAFENPVWSIMPDGVDRWLLSYFKNVTGRFIHLGCQDAFDGPGPALMRMGWDCGYQAATEDIRSFLQNQVAVFNTASVSGRDDFVPAYHDLVYLGEDGLHNQLMACAAKVVCVPASLAQHFAARQIHRTDRHCVFHMD